MLPLTRAFDHVRAFLPVFLATLALTFGANALIGDGGLFPATDTPTIVSAPQPKPPATIEAVDAAVSTAATILQLDNVEIEWDILDRDEQCCPYHSRHLHGRVRWHEDW